ncbi:MAG TPA: tetratricopeptide repeat protein [Ktedonosporobacter sp.]|nr:tetratricopeptide repeat protein [Ktedonosporobacter sp.]
MAITASMKQSSHQNDLLRAQRLRRNWTQKKVADEVKAPDDRTVARWESGVMPGSEYRERFYTLYQGIPAHALGFVPGKTPFWNIPQRAPFFTGRDQLLAHIGEALTPNQATGFTQPLLLQGLAGIGKTATAIEYAYRHYEWYQLALWVNAETPEKLTADYLLLAELLADLLPPLQTREGQEARKAIEAVKNVLDSLKRWLLVFDNAEDLSLVREFLPHHIHGHVLITTRQQASGPFTQRFVVNTMDHSEGALLLLRRAKYLGMTVSLEEADQTMRAEALGLSRDLGGLPLVIDQAGAYVEEVPETLERYRGLYQERQQRLLVRRGRGSGDHPQSVLTTLSLSFDHIQQESRASADLLRLCAFLAPEEIPEEIFTRGASILDMPLRMVASNPIELGEAIEVASRQSLLTRDPHTCTLGMHRVVQAVLKGAMEESSQRHWAELAVQAVNLALPNIEDREAWEQNRRVFPHALTCTALITQWDIASPQVARLLAQTGNALWVRGQYSQAETLHKQALVMRETLLGSLHPDVAESLAYLATAYSDQGRYDLADPLYLRALDLSNQSGQAESLFTARVLNALAEGYREREMYAQAESLYLQAQAIAERLQDSNSLPVAMVLSNRVGVSIALGRFEEAEPLLIRACNICEQHLGPAHPTTLTLISNLGMLYCGWGKYDQAEPLMQQALAARRTAWGGDNHTDVAQSLNNLGELYLRQKCYDRTEPLFLDALNIYQSLGLQNHLFTELVLRNYAQLLEETQRLQEAHEVMARAEAINAARMQHVRAAITSSKETEFEAFFAACCQPDPRAREALADLWTAYRLWAKRGELTPSAHHERELAAFLETKGCARVRTKRARMWRGVMLRDEYRVQRNSERR